MTRSPQLTASLDSSVVRIYNPTSNNVVGAGFLVEDRLILTCAHVVAHALGIDRSTVEIPNGTVELDFPLVAPNQRLRARIVFWRPVNPDMFGEDIARLELEPPLPDKAQAARLVRSENLCNHPFRVLGFPLGKENGAWAYGKIKGRCANGWLQLEGTRQTGYSVEHGFSGAPIWDDELQGIVGMAVEADINRPNIRVAFMIPTEVLDTALTPSDLPKRKIPSLLPYLVNRIEQEYELGRVIVRNSPSPLICIIHGDEFQSHDKFLERLHKVSLPRFLGEESIKKYHLPSPPKLNNWDEFSGHLHRTLADIVIGRNSASQTEINDFFHRYPCPILIHTHLLTEQLKEKFETLDNLVKFWCDEWTINSNQNLIICIFIKYQIKRKMNTENSGIIKLFNFLNLNYLVKKYRYEKANQKISQHIKSLCNSERSNPLVLVPELTGVSRSDAENWVRDHTQNFIGEAMAENLMKRIRNLFDNWEEKNSSNKIPMDHLAQELIKVLKSNC